MPGESRLEHPITSSQSEQELGPRISNTYTYVISLSLIAILSLSVHFMLDQVIAEQSQTGHIVNLSGQQRMLSQRTTMFTLEFLRTGSAEDKELALAALSTIRKNHETLLQEHYASLDGGRDSPLSSEMQALYFEAPN